MGNFACKFKIIMNFLFTSTKKCDIMYIDLMFSETTVCKDNDSLVRADKEGEIIWELKFL